MTLNHRLKTLVATGTLGLAVGLVSTGASPSSAYAEGLSDRHIAEIFVGIDGSVKVGLVESGVVNSCGGYVTQLYLGAPGEARFQAWFSLVQAAVLSGKAITIFTDDGAGQCAGDARRITGLALKNHH